MLHPFRVIFTPHWVSIFLIILLANLIAVFAPIALIDDFVAMIIAGCLICGAIGGLIVLLFGDLFGAAYVGCYVWLGSLFSLAILSAIASMYGAGTSQLRPTRRRESPADRNSATLAGSGSAPGLTPPSAESPPPQRNLDPGT
jgi:hypothetical protein